MIGVAVFTAWPGSPEGALSGHRDPATPVAPPSAAAPAVIDTKAAAAPVDGNPDAAGLEQQRRVLARTVATLPMVGRVIWSSPSTMEVFLSTVDADSDAMTGICPLVEHYPALAASRVQLTPPPGSNLPVRFRQCRAY
jgi:hypothetical protein